MSPIGNDVQSSWESLLAGVSGGAPITHFEATDDFACRIGCEAKGFDPLDYLDKREVKRHDRVSQFAVAAATQALREAGLEGVPEGGDPERFGVIFGSGIGGIGTFEEQHRRLIEKGPNRVSPFFIPMLQIDLTVMILLVKPAFKILKIKALILK